MLNIHSGSNNLLADELCRIISSIDHSLDIYVVVPRQLTLLTEQIIMRELSLESSFRIQVYNSSRICKLIFDEAGYPSGDRIDERGRVMLCRRALHDVRNELSIYRDAEKRIGFAPRCAEQIEIMIQGGLSAENLLEISAVATGSDAHKIRDLGLIMRRYTELTEGLYRDTETEMIDATGKAEKALFLRNACFIFFGFAIVPPTLTNFAAAIASCAADTHILLPLKNDSDSDDYDCYRPMEKTLNRLLNACKEVNVPYQRFAITDSENKTAIVHLFQQLYSTHLEPFNGDISSVSAFTARTIREECACVAATARRICREKGISYGDMQILCTEPEIYRSALKEAFESYDVPLMFDAGRPVSRIGAAEVLLFALRTIAEGYRLHDVIALIRTGYCGILQYEADQLENYAIRNGIDGTRWNHPFTRGKEYELEKAEEYRLRIIPPLEKLHDRLVMAKTLKGQLTAMFEYLSCDEIDARRICQTAAKQFTAEGKNEEASLISQSWNRLISTLDMMHDLLGEESLSLVELFQTLANALDVSMIKILPQTTDSVYVQSANSLLHSKPRVIFAVGLYDRATGSGNALLLPNQQRFIFDKTGAYLGPGEEDAPLQRRYFLKESISMASEMLVLSCSMVGFDGASHKLGEELRSVAEILPSLSVQTVDNFREILLGAVKPALEHTALTYGKESNDWDLSAKASLSELADNDIDIRTRLEQLELLHSKLNTSEYIDSEHTGDLYRHINNVSITQLESYAKCPFDHFIRYGLRPEMIDPFEMTFADVGNFLHGCMHDFLVSYKDRLNGMSPSEAGECMHTIAEHYIEKIEKATHLIEDSSVSRQNYSDLIDRACVCASAVASHMNSSMFHVEETELRFNSGDDSFSSNGDGTALNGAIDRIDTWSDGNRVRVIDYKSSERKPDPSELLDGSALQLAVYMGIAEEKSGARCAGMYYFPMLDPYINNESRLTAELEKERSNSFRMSGIHSADPEIILAQSATPVEVFANGVKADGHCSKSAPAATDEDFNRLIRHTQKKVGEHMEAIRSGDSRAYPLKNGIKSACTYCQNHSACLFDPVLRNERKISKVTWENLFAELILENTPSE